MNEEIKFLKELQHELKTQEIDGQASPRYWVVGDYKWIPTDVDNATRTSIFTYDDCECMELETYIDNLKESGDYTDEQMEELENIFDWQDDEDTLKWIKENVTDDCHLVYEKKEHVIKENTMFLTKQEAKEHIRLNHYHYTKEAHTYAMTAWRSPQVEKLINILETFDWDSVKVAQEVKG